MRDILKLVETGKEAETVLKKREVLIDGRVVTDHAFPLGLIDVLSIPKIKKFYRCTVTKDGLKLIEIDESESKVKLCRIKNKTTVRNGKQQLNLHDGRSILVEGGKEKSSFATGDSVLIEVPKQKITEHIKLEKGSAVLIIEGGNAGVIAKVKDVIIVKGKEPNKVVFEYEGKQNETIADHVLVVGKTKPIVTISGSE
jgi:small subunit ribosomal protein S4e